MPSAKRGDVWLVDLGMAAKVRPCLVLSVPIHDEDRALVTLVPCTTAVRGSRFEVAIDAKFLRRLGSLTDEQLQLVETSVRDWLGLS